MKPLLAFDKERTFIEKIVEGFTAYGSEEIIIVVNNDVREQMYKVFPESVKIILNENPATGRMNSVKLGIQALHDKNHCFIHNADNPFVSHELFYKMSKRVDDSCYVVPVFMERGGHPILIGKSITEYICFCRNLPSDLRKVLCLYKRNDIPAADDRILRNINTKSDYQKYFGKK